MFKLSTALFACAICVACGTAATATTAAADATGDAALVDSTADDVAKGGDATSGEVAGADAKGKDAVDTTDAGGVPLPDPAAVDAALDKHIDAFAAAICKGQNVPGGCAVQTCEEEAKARLLQPANLAVALRADMLAGLTKIDAVQEAKCFALFTPGTGFQYVWGSFGDLIKWEGIRIGNGGLPEPCRAMYVGQLPDGVSCGIPRQCASGDCRMSQGMCSARTCQPATKVGAACPCSPGQACVNGKCALPKASDCISGCLGLTACGAQGCVKLPGAGEQCDTSEPSSCEPGLICMDQIDGSPALCTAPGYVGTVCAEDSWCKKGLGCVIGAGPPGECQPCVVSGTSCTYAGDCTGNAPVCSDGKCAPLLAKGAACANAPTGHPICATGLQCDPKTGKCQDLPGTGQACGENGLCGGDNGCVNGKCQAPLSGGAKCQANSTDQCRLGFWCVPSSSGGMCASDISCAQ